MTSRLEDALTRKMVGPPAPTSKYDNIPRPMRLEDEKKRRSDVDWLSALLAVSQATDLGMTEKGIGTRMRRPTTEEVASAGYDLNIPQEYEFAPLREGNPLPGMQHPTGRMAWGAAENKGLDILRKKKPALGVPATVAAALIHLFLANGWRRSINKYGERD